MTALDPAAARIATLRERARRIAAAERAAPTGDRIEVLVFQLAWENYAIETVHIREIFPLKDLTAIPCTPAFMLGVINLRGELCPVIDLKRLFNLPEQGLTNATSAVILHSTSMEFGILADVIVGVQGIGLDEVHPPPATLTGINRAFLRGVTQDRTVVLDGAAILGHPSIIVNQQVEG